MKVKSESEVAQLCPTPSNPMDCSPPGSSIHGICQAKLLTTNKNQFYHEEQKTFQNTDSSVNALDKPMEEGNLSI